jgi:tRNA threonylcarbamoyladenosine modification (KEOPS) complex Cgi121 subunit
MAITSNRLAGTRQIQAARAFRFGIQRGEGRLQPRRPRSYGFVFDGIRYGIESGGSSAAGIVEASLPERGTKSSKYSVKINQTRHVNINIKVLKEVLHCKDERQTGVDGRGAA